MRSELRRSQVGQRAVVPAGVIEWIYQRQYCEDGQLLFDFASNFRLNNATIDDRLGERTLDRYEIRIDGTLRST